MKRIVAIIHPFDKYQTIHIYTNNNQTNVSNIITSEVCEYICSLLIDEEITSINLLGSRQYNKGLTKKIQEFINNNYSNRNIDINIL